MAKLLSSLIRNTFLMIKDFFYKIMTNIHYRQALRRLRLLEKKLFSQQARFIVPFVYRGKGYFKLIEPRQNKTEIATFYKTVCELAPKRILEIGTARGGTLYLWTQAAVNDATIVSVDLPGGEFGGAYPSCRGLFYKAFARQGQKINLLRKNSHDAETVEEVTNIFKKQAIDFAFIDGDHTYEGVKTDFFHYLPLVRPGGIIALHDILPRSDLPEIQVYRFWNEVRGKYDSEEIIGPEGSKRRVGIGVVRVGN